MKASASLNVLPLTEGVEKYKICRLMCTNYDTHNQYLDEDGMDICTHILNMCAIPQKCSYSVECAGSNQEQCALPGMALLASSLFVFPVLHTYCHPYSYLVHLVLGTAILTSFWQILKHLDKSIL